MATVPTPPATSTVSGTVDNIPINLSVAGPVVGCITSVANAVTAVCTLLATPQGQASIAAVRGDMANLETKANSVVSWIGKQATAVTGFFGGILGKL